MRQPRLYGFRKIVSVLRHSPAAYHTGKRLRPWSSVPEKLLELSSSRLTPESPGTTEKEIMLDSFTGCGARADTSKRLRACVMKSSSPTRTPMTPPTKSVRLVFKPDATNVWDQQRVVAHREQSVRLSSNQRKGRTSDEHQKS